VVVAHELAHVRAGHVLKGTSWIVVLAAPVCLLLFALVVWRTGGRSPTRDAAGCDLVVRRLAVLLAGAAVIAAVSAPLQAWVSRSFEREAELGALELTRDPEAAIALQHGLLRSSRNVPDPPVAVRVLFGSHPTVRERIGMAWRGRMPPWHAVTQRPPSDRVRRGPARAARRRGPRVRGTRRPHGRLRVDEVKAEAIQRGADRARGAEAERLRARLLARAYVVALDPEGRMPASSEAFAAWLGRRIEDGRPAASSSVARSVSMPGWSGRPTNGCRSAR